MRLTSPIPPAWAPALMLSAGTTLVAAAPVPPRPPTLEAVRTAEPPVIDAFLDEAAWARAAVVDDFIMQLPDEGIPSSERTEVRILYDDDNLYLGITCFDTTPEKIRASSLVRDLFGGTSGESFAFAIDSTNSGRDGFWFHVNPAGTQIDAQLFNEGEIFDREWDGIWTSAGRIHDRGWTVEIRMPFFNLRFQGGPENVMGMNFFRAIRHKNEEAYAPFIPRNYPRGTNTFSLARPVLFRGVRPGHALSFKPYGLASVSTEPADDSDTVRNADLGLDVKWGITPSITADFTVNPDFAQVEADTQQINFTRFPLFFPEKREFFLENAGLFAFGLEGSVQAFFSRRIGLDGDGNPIPITVGSRATGRVGRWTLGVLDVVSDEEDVEGGGVEPQTNYFVARLRRDVGRRSAVGAIVTDREASGPGGGNRLLGLDSRLVLGEDHVINAFAMTSRRSRSDLETDDDPGYEWAARASYRKNGDLWQWGANAGLTDEDFEPGVGFVRRTGVQFTDGFLAFRPRPESIRSIRQLRFQVNALYQEARTPTNREVDHTIQDRSFILSHTTEFESGDEIRLSLSDVFERINEDEEFEIFDDVVIDAGDYDQDSYQLSFETFDGRRYSGEGSFTRSRTFDGYRNRTRGRFTVRVSPHLTVASTFTHNRFRLPAGDFDTNLWVTQIDYGFNPALFGGALLQWNDTTDSLDLNLRLDWIHTPGADLFVVFNQSINTSRDPDEPRTNSRGGIVKLTYLFHF